MYFEDFDLNNDGIINIMDIQSWVAQGRQDIANYLISEVIPGNVHPNHPYIPKLKENSEILFEFKDQNGVVIFSDLLNFDDFDGAAYAYVWVKKDPLRTFDEIIDGMGTLTIVGELGDVPDEWKGDFNVRTVIPIEVRKRQPNNSEILLRSSSLAQTKINIQSYRSGDRDIFNIW